MQSVLTEPMDPFRLILILVGIALLILVYYLSRRSVAKSKSLPRRKIPMSGHVSPPERPYQVALETEKPERRKRFVKYLGSNASSSTAKQNLYDNASGIAPMMVTVYVMPLTGIQFRREQVTHCLESLGCMPRTDEKFDYLILDESSGKRVNRLFTIHDVHENGIFSHDTDAAASTNGLVLEMQLPAPMESVMAFEKLLDIARLVATKLNGVVCDDLQNRLTKQATMHIKDRIQDYNRKMRFTQSSSMQ